MKTIRECLQRFKLSESPFGDVAGSVFLDPSHWGIEDTDVSRVTLHDFLQQHQDAEHVMLVDDMEGLGLRDAIEQGDLMLASKIATLIAKKYPENRYNPFGNDFEGSGPEGMNNQG